MTRAAEVSGLSEPMRRALGSGTAGIIARLATAIAAGVTSHDRLDELAAPSDAFEVAGAEITLASPKGGQPPLDPKSNEPGFQTGDPRRFESDPAMQAALAKTQRLDTVSHEGFDAVFYPGSHGSLWNLAEDRQSIGLIEATSAAAKPVALVCHAPGILRHAKVADGTPRVQAKTVTGFANTVEAAMALTDIVSFLVEDALKRNGGLSSKAGDSASCETGRPLSGEHLV